MHGSYLIESIFIAILTQACSKPITVIREDVVRSKTTKMLGCDHGAIKKDPYEKTGESGSFIGIGRCFWDQFHGRHSKVS